MGRFLPIVAVASCFAVTRCLEADDYLVLLQTSAGRVPRHGVKLNDRVVAQWGGNNLWYSGTIAAISTSTACNILPDNGLTASNKDGWTDLSPERVYVGANGSSLKNSQSEWCWRASTPSDCHPYTLVQSTTFQAASTTTTTTTVADVVVKMTDRVVAQWGGNNLWYSGTMMAISSPTACNINPDNGLSADNVDGWTDVSPERVYVGAEYNEMGNTSWYPSQTKWCWQGNFPWQGKGSTPSDCWAKPYELVQSTRFQFDTTTTTTTTAAGCGTWCSNDGKSSIPWCGDKCDWTGCAGCDECSQC